MGLNGEFDKTESVQNVLGYQLAIFLGLDLERAVKLTTS
jgi:hypothetical protein